MRPEHREMRLRQLSESLAAFADETRNQPRPRRGWLHAVREALGLTLRQVGELIHTTRQQIQAFENAEAQDRITLGSLRRVAEAVGCDLVYRIVPKSGSMFELAEKRARQEATRRGLAVEHTMALEDQAAGDVQRTIDDETRRILLNDRAP
jgi:predicted DNA-binding mobile mystery protein A